jgi:hypothetical protein
MEIKAGDVHFIRPRDNIQTVQPTQDPRVHFRVDFPDPTLLPKLSQTLAFEARDHINNVSELLTHVNYLLTPAAKQRYSHTIVAPASAVISATS